jgi:hypothetical protein
MFFYGNGIIRYRFSNDRAESVEIPILLAAYSNMRLHEKIIILPRSSLGIKATTQVFTSAFTSEETGEIFSIDIFQ